MPTEDDKSVKTKFKGPGQWRSQAAKLEGQDKKSPEKEDKK
jgi:hypothetical protein